ncbi:hypothetical protein FGG08_002341 [Glutinoglossum americanum]|uniref:Mannosyl phosphorylinositol ceramide synthase SUR1 n=1 Tax=Glutinoglossum americanum TaxID=1670608 RepID=A0A9P8I0F6_9PEZI|nr:hypothetical protein FGG08_002341 [Glutinoglossum americanum]
MVKIRRGVVIFLFISVVVVGFLVRSVFTLITLLFEDGLRDAIPRAEIPPPNSELIGKRPQLIPKIIHQTYKNESIPERWREAQQSCLDMHPDYEYKLWTDEGSRRFIAAEYSWFLDTFDGYPEPIQRADAIRYFVLAHFGGIYIDLDDVGLHLLFLLHCLSVHSPLLLVLLSVILTKRRQPKQGCNRRLDPLLSYHAWVRRTVPTGISNDAMGAVPQHPFFLRVIEMLKPYNRKWLLPYITVMYSTGPLFLSVIWKEYMRTNPDEDGRVRILMPNEYSRHEWSFFTFHKGNSWHGKDAQLIFWMGRHWLFLTVLGFAASGLVGLVSWWIYSRVFLHGNSPPPKSTLRSPTSRRFPKFWQRTPRRERYELLENRHEV